MSSDERNLLEQAGVEGRETAQGGAGEPSAQGRAGPGLVNEAGGTEARTEPGGSTLDSRLGYKQGVLG